MKQIETRPGCIKSALAILGDQWTALILREVSNVPRTFSELEIGLVGISPRTLSQRLEKLTYEGILQKECYCEHPPRYKYCLTAKGDELLAVLIAMSSWGEKYYRV